MTELLPPIDRRWIERDLRSLGVEQNMALLFHGSLRALSGKQSMVLGAELAVLDAVRSVLGPGGLLCMPAFSADYSEPARWSAPPVPELWWPIIRETWPPFRPGDSPTFRIGCLAETFRKLDGVVRSNHPQSSFAAWGAGADELVADHPLSPGLGDESPLGKLYARDARVLMLGSGWDACTCFHLAEPRMASPPPVVDDGAPVLRDGARTWVTFRDYDYDAGDFAACGDAWERTGAVTRGVVGRAETRLFRLRDAVDYAVGWLDDNRSRSQME